MNKTAFLAYVPFTGLGLYNGFRGNRWLRNRITIFKQFVIPSLLNQTDKDFTLWISWRPDERTNPHVQELAAWLRKRTDLNFVFTFSGLCFWDDKYPDEVANVRLASALHGAVPELLDVIGDAGDVIMMLQPSDDIYEKDAVLTFKAALDHPDYRAATYTKGYMCNYRTKEVREYNPTTNPPFFAYKMPKEIFINPRAHMEYTGPYKSHEYIGNKMRLVTLCLKRGFMVGTHGENISTYFDNPFGGDFIVGEYLKDEILDRFGILSAPTLVLPFSLRKWLLRHLSHGVRRKLRYWLGERLYHPLYNYLRN